MPSRPRGRAKEIPWLLIPYVLELNPGVSQTRKARKYSLQGAAPCDIQHSRGSTRMDANPTSSGPPCAPRSIPRDLSN